MTLCTPCDADRLDACLKRMVRSAVLICCFASVLNKTEGNCMQNEFQKSTVAVEWQSRAKWNEFQI
jgi:hypothetical protein